MKHRLALCVLLFLPAILFAHPHMMLITRLEFDFEGSVCRGIWVDWGFDSFFSESIIFDYDLDDNGYFDEQETREVYTYAFTNLENFGYFVYFRIGEKRLQARKVSDFSVRQENGRLFYTFYIPLSGMGIDNDFFVSVFDPTYFCAVMYTESPVDIRQEAGAMPRYRLEENSDYPVYYNPFGDAKDTTTYDTWKPGLETAYPEEVHVFFE